MKEFSGQRTDPNDVRDGQGTERWFAVPNELRFAYWQKWTWETPDIPVAMIIAGTMRDAPLSPRELAAYDAPFPDASYKMGPRAMPSLVPTLPDDPALPAQAAAWKVFSQWRKPFLCAFTDDDPVTKGGDVPFREQYRGRPGNRTPRSKGAATSCKRPEPRSSPG